MFIISKREFNEIPIELLLLADPEIEKINQYKDDSVFFAAEYGKDIIGVVVLCPEDKQIIEIKNIAVSEEWQGKKAGRALLEKAIDYSSSCKFDRIIIKTGDAGISQLALYQKMGFEIETVNKDYFLANYREPIYENGIRCRNQIVLVYRLYSESEQKKSVKEYWARFISSRMEYKDSPYEVWGFGYGSYLANLLGGLVRMGKKTGTSSALEIFGADEKIPEAGDLSVITYGNGLPACIIKTVEVRTKPLNEITGEEAALEGEGDLSLEYWKTVHREFFGMEFNEKGMKFHDGISVVYEIFELVYDENS